ncbi:hypothetical protein [Microcystis phage Mwe-JY07]
MSLGVGLGAFMDGVQRGYGLGERMREQGEARDRKQQMQTIARETKDKFGDVLSDDAYDYMARRQAAVYAEAGDTTKAEQYRTWAEGREARQGTKLFARGLVQFQGGDIEGGFRTAQELARQKGYGDVFNLESWQPIVDSEGKTLGHRVVIKGPDGKPMTQDIPRGREQQLFAQIANPQAAFEAEQRQREGAAKSQREITEYRQKKEIDRDVGSTGNDQKRREDAIKALRDNSRTFGPKQAQTFDELGEAEKEAEIAREIKLRRGDAVASPAGAPQTAAPGIAPQPGSAAGAPAAGSPQRRGGYVNDVNGQALTVPQAQQKAAGLGAVAAPQAAPAAPAAAPPSPPARPPGLGIDRAAMQADDDLAREDLAKVERDIAQVTSRSRDPTAAAALLGPLQTRRQELQNKLHEAARQAARQP